MDLRIFTEPQQGATYQQLLEAAQAAESAGFGAFFRSDHFLAMGSADGLPGPTDAWLTLAALARETSRIRLGTLVTSATFRLPGLLAVQVAQVDEMSGGRVELGLGTGWYDGEHTAYGVPFPPLGERFDRLAEQLEIITGMWAAPGPYSFHGTHYDLTGCPALPKPVQAHVPVIVGGGGAKRTPALAARFADEFNLPFASVEATGAQFARVREAAGDRALVYSAAQVVCCGRTEAEVTRRAAAIGREVEELRAHGVAGTPDECVARLRELAAVGTSRAYLQVLDLDDLDHIALLGSEVLPALA
jgi:F420-dependent oxidoreductase-like protein